MTSATHRNHTRIKFTIFLQRKEQMEAHHLALQEAVKTTEAPHDKEGNYLHNFVCLNLWFYSPLVAHYCHINNAFKQYKFI